MRNTGRFHLLTLALLLVFVGWLSRTSPEASQTIQPSSPRTTPSGTPAAWKRSIHHWKAFTWSCESPENWTWKTAETLDDSWIDFGPDKTLRVSPLPASTTPADHLKVRRQHQEGSYRDLRSEVFIGSNGSRQWAYQMPSRPASPYIEGVVEVQGRSLLLWGLGFTADDLPNFLRVLHSVDIKFDQKS